MGSESIAHEAEGRIGYSLRGYKSERNNCFSKIQLVGHKNIEIKHLSLVNPFSRQNITNMAGAFRY